MVEIIKERINYIFIVTITFVFGFIGHGYIYLNGIFSHDASRIFQNDFSFQISLGRFLQPIYLWFRGYISAPFLIGIISLSFLSLAICVIVKIFNIKKASSIILLCAILSINATISLGNASYMPWSDIYMLSFFLSTVAVYSYINVKKYGFIITILCIVIVCGLYQPYFASIVALFIIYEIICIMNNENNKKIISDGIKEIATLLIGLLVYYLVLNIVLKITGVSLSDGSNSINGVGTFRDISLIQLIINTYKYFAHSFIRPITYHHNFCGLINIMIFILIISRVIFIVKNRKLSISNSVLLFVSLMILPLGFNIIYFISKGSVHELVTYSFYLVYLFAIILIDDLDKHSVTKKIQIFLLFLLVLNNIIYSNQLYLKKDLEFKSTLSVMTRVIDRIEQTEGYEVGVTPIAIVGELNSSALSVKRFGFSEIVGIGVDDFGSYSTTYDLTYYWYFSEILGYPVTLLSGYEFKNLSEVVEMDVFPSSNSVKMVNGVVVVKLSY